MAKINGIIVFACFALFFYACKSQLSSNKTCEEKLKLLRTLAYTNYDRQPALDSALHLANECMQCDSIKMEVIDFKWRILATLKRYDDAVAFIDSLKESDFTFAYKQRYLSKALRALAYISKNDTANRNNIYKEMAADIDRYVKKRTISEEEFQEIYLDLYEVKKQYLDTTQVNKEIDSLKMTYDKKQ